MRRLAVLVNGLPVDGAFKRAVRAWTADNPTPPGPKPMSPPAQVRKFFGVPTVVSDA